MGKRIVEVVGTREVGERELEDARRVLEDILKDHVVVSGMAIGCEAFAYKFAIENGIWIIAVLGNPLEHPNKSPHSLKEKIRKEHLLLSQYLCGIITSLPNFINSNLTIIALSTDGLIVIKAGDKGWQFIQLGLARYLKSQSMLLKQNFAQIFYG